MIYEVTKGHPLVGDGKCEISAYDGCGRHYFYNGWYSLKRREWRLYPRTAGTTTGMVILGERDVYVPKSTARVPQKSTAMADKQKKTDPPEQLPLI